MVKQNLFKKEVGRHWQRVTAAVLLSLTVFFAAPHANAQSLPELVRQVKKAYKGCKKTHSLRQCRRALMLYKKALKLRPGNSKIKVRIKELDAIIKQIKAHKKPKAYRPRYKDLISAARVGYARDVRYWLRHHADVNATDKAGRTALHYAAQLGLAGMRVLKMLIKAQADPTITDNQGLTPLHLSALAGYAPAVKVLLKAKADPTIMNNDNKTAYDMAVADAKAVLTAGLKVNAPENAIVKIDDRIAGMTDDSGVLEVKTGPGMHEVDVKKTGFKAFKKEMNLSLGEQELQANLVPLPPPKPVVVQKPKPVTHKPKPVVVFKPKPVVAQKLKPKPLIARKKIHPVETVRTFKHVKSRAKKFTTWGTVSFVSGIVFVGLGGLMSGLAVSDKNRIDNSSSPLDLQSSRSNSKVKGYQVASWVFYPVGAALIGTGIYLWVRGHREKSVSAMVSPNSIGLIVRY